MATLTFSPPIIKLALLIILVMVTAGVSAWIVWKDVQGMRKKAEVAEKTGCAGWDKKKKEGTEKTEQGQGQGVINLPPTKYPAPPPPVSQSISPMNKKARKGKNSDKLDKPGKLDKGNKGGGAR